MDARKRDIIGNKVLDCLDNRTLDSARCSARTYPNLLIGRENHYESLESQTRFRFSLSNIFNHPNFFAPYANISAPGEAGVISETHGLYSGERAGPRMVEFRVRLSF